MRIIAMFNLKADADAGAYEAWARSRDIPGVRSLVSVKDFDVLKATGVMFKEGAEPPFRYIEIFDISTMDEFMRDCAGDIVSGLAKEMAAFVDDATFVTTEKLLP